MPMPANAIAALDARPPGVLRFGIAYAEQIFHPALVEPVTAAGTFHMADDGTLIRAQEYPEREIAEIGRNTIRLRSDPDAEANLVPIPEDIEPMLATVRALVAGEPRSILETYSVELLPHEGGWQVVVDSDNPMGALTHLAVIGCGETLRAVELDLADGGRRRIVLGHGP